MASEKTHEVFTTWVKKQGVRIHGLAPSNLPGKGVGIVATKKLKKGEVILEIPASALITHDTQFVQDAGFHDATVYGAVAAAFTLQHENEDRWYKAWQATWPSFEDVRTSMPLCWSASVREYLTPSACARFEYQKNKYDRDCTTVGPRIPEHLHEWFKYYWLIVDSRCFFWEFFARAEKQEELKKQKGKKRRKIERILERDEYLALVPWGDFFNHADEGCRVFFTAEQVRVECDRAYKLGEEVVTSYGEHGNDYLLIDYGFILSSNRHDTLTLDHIILPLLTESQHTFLSESNYLGKYILSSTGICFRTQVAIRALVSPTEKLEEFIAGTYDGAGEDGEAHAKVLVVLGMFEKQAKTAIGELKKLAGEEYAIDVLKRRWMQVLEMIDLVREEMSENSS